MTSHSIASGLKATVPEKSVFVAEGPDDHYDVTIQFYSAEQLPRTDLIGHTDPYFVAKIDNQITFTSTIIPNTGAPQWNDEIWIVRNIPSRAKLYVKLFDKDDEKPLDDYIGHFRIKNLIDYVPPAHGEKIIGPCGTLNGYFHLSIHAEPSAAESQELPPYTYDGPCRYSRHDSVAVGLLTMLNSRCIYSTWKVQLKRIPAFFPPYERQHWNKHYKKAQTIFGHCPVSLASKRTIKLGHRALFARTLKHNQVGQINSTASLWKSIFTDPITGRIRPCIYTYVIDDHSWRFSETGHQFFKDFASKHALLANVSQTVRYAGEFHPRPKYGWNRCDDEWELVFDNDSGTYAPTRDLLENLKDLFLFNFPGLNIVTYDHTDPALKQSLDQLKVVMKKYRHLMPALGHLTHQRKSLPF